MTYTDTPQSVVIEGITEPAIVNYFATINREDFAATANLFSDSGVLNAPFEKPIVGQKAIASYLAKEARGMKLLPKQGISTIVAEDCQEIKVTGKVKTPLFGVNVAWHFDLDRNDKITSATIKLLASPQELLGLKQSKEQS